MCRSEDEQEVGKGGGGRNGGGVGKGGRRGDKRYLLYLLSLRAQQNCFPTLATCRREDFSSDGGKDSSSDSSSEEVSGEGGKGGGRGRGGGAGKGGERGDKGYLLYSLSLHAQQLTASPPLQCVEDKTPPVMRGKKSPVRGGK